MRPYLLILTLLSLLLTESALYSQDEKPADKPQFGWTKKEVVGGINLTQTSFDNWSQGGENTFSWQLNLNFNFTKDEEKFNWANTGKFAYGTSKVGDQETRKSVDEFKLETVYTHKLGVYINPYVAATGETQMMPGYNYSDDSKTKLSDFMDPGYFRESLGVGFEPNKVVKTRLGAALKQTISSDYGYADDPDTDEIEKTKNEIGAESVTDVSWKVSENSLFTSKLELFSNLKAFDEIDVNWDNLLTAKVSNYVNFNFNIKLLYDKDISKKRQIKQALALGLTYNFL